ncbi:Paired amphipathic helix protein Sin3-like 2 [Psilocybe cubensis]|nr:Paired amphipathic helix protein Sin3-like 2 [Psilocybe cubensis]KAH9477605.1 Paired amphipathic helix protein Sin3-like 2 [Psilocybe cubensis]
MEPHGRKPKATVGGLNHSSVARDDYNAYLDAVKRAFSDQPAIYDEFLSTLRQWNQNEFSTDILLKRIREMLKGHSDLIQRFNVFLPEGVTMDASTSTRNDARASTIQKLDTMYRTIRLTEKVLSRCGQNVYDDMFSILSAHYHREVDQETTTRKLTSLLTNQADLLDSLLYIIGSDGDPMLA